MSNLTSLTMVGGLLPVKSLLLLGFMRQPRFFWFFRRPRRPMFLPPCAMDPRLLVALAELEAAAGRNKAAASLLEAAYMAFDQRDRRHGSILNAGI